MRCGLARCPGAKSIRFSIIPVVSFSHVHTISSKLNVILLIYHLAAGYPLCHHNTLDFKENNQHGLELGTTHACIFCSWRWRWLPLHWLSLGFWIIHKYPNFITSNYRIPQIWFILNAMQKVQTHFLPTFFLFVWQQFWNNFSQTFLMFSSSLRIHRTLSLSKLTSSATARKPRLRSFRITSHTFSMLSLVSVVHGWPGR